MPSSTPVIRCAETGQVFELVKKLKVCKCGAIWYAIRAKPHGGVVLKIIEKRLLETQRADDEEKRRVTLEDPVHEFRTLDFLNYHGHPAVIKSLGHSFVTGDAYIAIMEHMPGGDLLELVAKYSRLDEPTSRHFFCQVLAGVQYLHKMGITHLDVSLENVALSADYRTAKLLDFGLSLRIAADATGAEMYLPAGPRGKNYYIAPEVFAGMPFKGTIADVWSAGVVLFIMLTGAPPVELPVRTDPRFECIAKGKLELILQAWKMGNIMSASAFDLVKRMLVVDPAKRISMAHVARHPFVTGKPFGMAPPPVPGGGSGARQTAAASSAATVAGGAAGGAGAGAGAGVVAAAAPAAAASRKYDSAASLIGGSVESMSGPVAAAAAAAMGLPPGGQGLTSVDMEDEQALANLDLILDATRSSGVSLPVTNDSGISLPASVDTDMS